jgi:hypothetical protein
MRTKLMLWMVLISVTLCAGVARADLPANLQIDPALASGVQWLWSRSPTFRRQCQRIGTVDGLGVHLALTPASPQPGADAVSVVRREAAGHGVRVQIGVSRALNQHRILELIAHELEHVVEQIDGIDLDLLTLRGVAGVYSTGDHRFETARAAAIGRRVIQEAETNGAAS